MHILKGQTLMLSADILTYIIFLTALMIMSFPKEACAEPNEKESESRKEDATATASTTNSGGEQIKGTVTSLQKYKYLFAEHRATQLEAVKSMSAFGDNKQRYQLINVMLKQLFKTIAESKQNLTLWGYLPGDPFPENETIRDGVSKVLENTAMFGDMVLHMPDIVHDLYDREKEWQLLMAWSYGFCLDSGVFEGPNAQLLELTAQEVDIIPKSENYVNPNRASNQKQQKAGAEEPKKKEKKPKKKIKRGPRLSHSEL